MSFTCTLEAPGISGRCLQVGQRLLQFLPDIPVGGLLWEPLAKKPPIYLNIKNLFYSLLFFWCEFVSYVITKYPVTVNLLGETKAKQRAIGHFTLPCVTCYACPFCIHIAFSWCLPQTSPVGIRFVQ